MKKVYYNSNYHPVADVNVMSLAEKLLTEDVIYTSNQLVIEAVRLLIYRRKLNHEDVEIYYYDKLIKPDKYARLDYHNTPEWELQTDWLMEML